MSVGKIKEKKTLLALFVVLTFLLSFLPMRIRTVYAEDLTGAEQQVEQIELQAEVIWANLPEDVSIAETTLRLLNGDEPIKKVSVDAGTTVVTFAPVDKYDSEGIEISYRLEQDPMEDFETTVNDFVVENTYIKPAEIPEETPDELPQEEAPSDEETPLVEETLPTPPVEEIPPEEETPTTPPKDETPPVVETPPALPEEETQPVVETPPTAPGDETPSTPPVLETLPTLPVEKMSPVLETPQVVEPPVLPVPQDEAPLKLADPIGLNAIGPTSMMGILSVVPVVSPYVLDPDFDLIKLGNGISANGKTFPLYMWKIGDLLYMVFQSERLPDDQNLSNYPIQVNGIAASGYTVYPSYLGSNPSLSTIIVDGKTIETGKGNGDQRLIVAYWEFNSAFRAAWTENNTVYVRTTQGGGFDVNNVGFTVIIPKVSATLNKTWINGAPTAVGIELYSSNDDGVSWSANPVVTVPLTPVSVGNGTFTATAQVPELPYTDDEGKILTYKAEELTPGSNYTSVLTSSYNSATLHYTFTVVNTYNAPLAHVTATKIWSGGPETDHIPVALRLWRVTNNNDATLTEITSVTPTILPTSSTALSYIYTWANLPQESPAALPYTYYFTEEVVNGYTRSYSGTPREISGVSYAMVGQSVTNTYQIPMTAATANKVWENGPATHPTVWFKLYRQIGEGDAEGVPGAPIETLLDGDLTGNWTGLAATDINGNPYTFSVKEGIWDGTTFTLGHPANYLDSYSNGGLTVTNSYQIPMTGTARATKRWVGGPQSHPTVWFKLYRQIEGGDPEPVPAILPQELIDGVTTADWSGLATTDINGNSYTFSVVEGSWDGTTFTAGAPDYYQVGYTTEPEIGLVVTNTYRLSQVTVSKVVTGNMGDFTKDFTFTATLKDAAGLPIEFPPPAAGSVYTLSADNKTATFNLRNGGNVTLLVPIGATLTVKESNYSGYTVSIKKNIELPTSGDSISMTVPATSTTLEFTNTNQAIIDTGVSMDSLPYLMILILLGTGGIGGNLWRRKRMNFD